MLLSVAMFFSVGADGKSSMLMGMHKVKLLSATSLIGAMSGLFIGVPLYYFFGEKGIVPAMTLLFICTYSFYSYGLRKALPRNREERFSLRRHKPWVKRMLAAGMVLLASSMINALFTYGINIFIRISGNMDDVGLFNAANGVTLQYTGMVFTAMAMDYFPRLTAVINEPGEMRRTVCRQMEIVALIATPLVIFLVASAPLVIRLLLTQEFLATTPLMRWLGLSILLKAIAYPLGYIAFAKDNKRLFFLLEGVVCNFLYLLLSLVFYYFFGLMGLGYAAVAEQGACIAIYLAVNFREYGFRPDRNAWTETAVAVALGTAAFCASIATEGPLTWYLLAAVFTVSAARSLLTLRKRIRTA